MAGTVTVLRINRGSSPSEQEAMYVWGEGATHETMSLASEPTTSSARTAWDAWFEVVHSEERRLDAAGIGYAEVSLAEMPRWRRVMLIRAHAEEMRRRADAWAVLGGAEFSESQGHERRALQAERIADNVEAMA